MLSRNQSCVEGVSFAPHNFNQIDRVLDHVASEYAEAMITVREWTSRAFWRRTESAARRRCVVLDFTLQARFDRSQP